MQAKQLDNAWAWLDAVYHDFPDEASAKLRALPPDDVNDLLWFCGQLIRGLVLGTENRLELDPGVGLKRIRSQFIHPSEGPCG